MPWYFFDRYNLISENYDAGKKTDVLPYGTNKKKINEYTYVTYFFFFFWDFGKHSHAEFEKKKKGKKERIKVTGYRFHWSSAYRLSPAYNMILPRSMCTTLPRFWEISTLRRGWYIQSMIEQSACFAAEGQQVLPRFLRFLFLCRVSATSR